MGCSVYLTDSHGAFKIDTSEAVIQTQINDSKLTPLNAKPFMPCGSGLISLILPRFEWLFANPVTARGLPRRRAAEPFYARHYLNLLLAHLSPLFFFFSSYLPSWEEGDQAGLSSLDEPSIAQRGGKAGRMSFGAFAGAIFDGFHDLFIVW